MLASRARRITDRTERGQAMIELAIVVPVIVMILFAVIQFGSSLGTKLDLEQISNEGVNTLNRLAELEQGTFLNLTPSGSCGGTLGAPAETKCPGQLFAQQRISFLLSLMNIPLDNINIETGYNPTMTAPPGTPGPLEDTVWVRITARHPGLLPGLAQNLLASARGPYLFEGQGFMGTLPPRLIFGVWDLEIMTELDELGFAFDGLDGDSINIDPDGTAHGGFGGFGSGSGGGSGPKGSIWGAGH